MGSVGFSLYLTSLDPGLLDRQSDSPPKTSHRAVGRPADETVREGRGISIYWPLTEHGRARRVLSRSGARRRYVVPCFRGQERNAHCEAPEEATGAVLLDACAGVEFQEQPARIEFEWLGKVLDHYPDCLAVAAEVKVFLEFKKDHEAADLYFRRRAERLAELLKELGYGYQMIPARSLKSAAYYDNAIAMRRDARLIARHPEWRQQVRSQMSRSCQETGRSILKAIPEGLRHSALLSLLYDGELDTDFSVPISLDSHIHPPLSVKGGLPWVWELFEKSS